MHKEPLLTAVPPAPVQKLSELYAIAFDVAQRAAKRYGALAERIDENFWPVRGVFEVLATRERDRCDRLSAACLAASGKRPDASHLRWAPIDLVPAAEIADIGDSRLSTPYTAWALAARHRQRAFVFWTYVIALAEDPLVRLAAESLAREALSDGNVLRRERRLAWRAERKVATDETAAPDKADEPTSAPLLESLLLRDIIARAASIPRPETSNKSRAGRCAVPSNCRTSISMKPIVHSTRAAWNWRRNLQRNPSCDSRACVISLLNLDFGDTQARRPYSAS
jgi:hypothetical protein